MQIHVCLGKYIYSSLAIAYSMENKCKVFFFLSPSHLSVRHLLMYDYEKSKAASCDDLKFSLPFATLKISTWPLTSKCHAQSFLFSRYPLRSSQPLRRKKRLCSSVCSMWRVQEVVCLASKRKLLNRAKIEDDVVLYSCRHSFIVGRYHG